MAKAKWMALAAWGLAVACAWGQTTTRPLTSGEELELKTLSGQLADPVRAAQTKLEAAELLLSKTYPQASEALGGFLRDPLNRSAQVAVAEAIAKHSEREERPEYIDPLMAMLTGEEPSVRAAAAKALSVYKNNGVSEKLVALALDKRRDTAIRIETIAALQRVLDKSAVDALVRLLDDRDQAIVDAAAEALAKLTNIRAFGADRRQWKNWWQKNANKPRSEWLVDLADSLARAKAALEAENLRIRDRLAKAMEDLYSATAAAQRDAMLISFLKDPLADVRLVGARIAERRLGSTEKVPPEIRQQVRALLSDPDTRVRRDIALLLANLGDAEAAKALLERLKAEDSAEVRKAVLTALGQLADPAALEPVLEEIKSTQPEIASAAAAALGRMAAKCALEGALRSKACHALVDRCQLIEKADENVNLREALLTAMGTVGGEEFVPVLREALKDPAATIRLAAVNGLRLLNKPDLASAIEPLVGDEDRGIRQAVLVALGALGGEKNLDLLLARTDSEKDPVVKQQAWDSVMAVLAKADVKVLSKVLTTLAKRADAAEPRVKIQQMRVASLRTAKSRDLGDALRQLGRGLVDAGRPAEAAPILAESYSICAAAKSDEAPAVWDEWVDAMLAADDPAVTKAMADQADRKAQAEAMERLNTRLESLSAKEKWQSVIQLCSSALSNLEAVLSAQEKEAMATALSEAKTKQLAADRQKVASLVSQLLAADEGARKTAAAEIQALGDRALYPLLLELQKVVAADAENIEAEKAVYNMIKSISPKTAGYDPAAAKADRVKAVEALLNGSQT